MINLFTDWIKAISDLFASERARAAEKIQFKYRKKISRKNDELCEFICEPRATYSTKFRKQK